MARFSGSKGFWCIGALLAATGPALLSGCGPEFKAPSSAGAGAAGASGGEGAAGGAGGGADAVPKIYVCHCFVQLPDGTIQPVDAHVCTEESDAPEACDKECKAFDDEINDAWLDYQYSTGDACDPKVQGERLSGGVPNSGEVVLDGGASRLTLRLGGAEYQVSVHGGVRFTGGCEASSCTLDLNQLTMEVGDVVIGTGAAAMLVRDVRLTNVGNLNAQHVDGYFKMPSEHVSLIVNGEAAGYHRAGWFTPGAGQDLYGYYSPSTGDFAIFGELYSAEQSVSLELYGTAQDRPPVANAGPSTTAFAAGNGMARVTLDGRDSFDPDDDLSEVLWYEGSTYVAKGLTTTVDLGIGKHTITARAIDAGHRWSDSRTTVEILK